MEHKPPLRQPSLGAPSLWRLAGGQFMYKRSAGWSNLGDGNSDRELAVVLGSANRYC